MQTEHGTETEGFGGPEDEEVPYLELWVETPEIGEPAFRWFVSSRSDLLEAYKDHVGQIGSEIQSVIETAPGAEWVVVTQDPPPAPSWERVWVKLRDW